MDKPPFEVADVIRMLAGTDGVVPRLRVSTAQQRVLNAILACRTAKLGGHLEVCDACDHELVAYNSCRNRHCPKCQGRGRAAWLEARSRDLLPVPYFHVVFTLPSELGTLALYNPRELYGLLFSAAADTLKEVAKNPKHLGAEIGFVAVLHTWTQTLLHHPHLHCVIPGGGLSTTGDRWISSSSDFFVSVRVLSKLFRGKFLARLQAMFDAGTLRLNGKLGKLADPRRFSWLCEKMRAKQWVVYAKPPFGGPEQVLKYLAGYTHRVAISNHRILNVDTKGVSFSYKDRAHGNRRRSMTLDSVAFLRRFVQHVLPTGFVRIRHFGILANRSRQNKISLCRSLLAESGHTTASQLNADHRDDHDHPMTDAEARLDATGDQLDNAEEIKRCPVCKSGIMLRTLSFDPQPRWKSTIPSPEANDTS